MAFAMANPEDAENWLLASFKGVADQIKVNRAKRGVSSGFDINRFPLQCSFGMPVSSLIQCQGLQGCRRELFLLYISP